MTRLPLVDYRTMERILMRQGFTIIRQKGSHVFFVIKMGVRQRCPIILAAIYPVH